MAGVSPLTRRAFLTGTGPWPAASDAVAEDGANSGLTISEACLPQSGIACMACGDVCPEQAIRFRPRAGGPFLPEIDDAACTLCGDCAVSCPAGAITLAGAEAADG